MCLESRPECITRGCTLGMRGDSAGITSTATSDIRMAVLGQHLEEPDLSAQARRRSSIANDASSICSTVMVTSWISTMLEIATGRTCELFIFSTTYVPNEVKSTSGRSPDPALLSLRVCWHLLTRRFTARASVMRFAAWTETSSGRVGANSVAFG